MGRSRYTEEERIQITAAFLSCTRQIIDREGLDALTIRRVAQCAGFNSATLYLYFKDIDELITMACIGYLEDYFHTLTEEFPEDTDPRAHYRRVWRVFITQAFAHPEIFLHLFFRQHSLPMHEILAHYNQLTASHPTLYGVSVPQLLMAGSLPDWNLHLMQPLIDSQYIPASQAGMINELMLCYFKKLLEDACGEDAPSPETLLDKMMDLGAFLLPVRS